jgi:hypothetical protein
MKRTKRTIMFLTLAAGLLAATCFLDSPRHAARAADEPAFGAASLEPPHWKVGDRWTIETVTERIQGREAQNLTPPPRVRWEFHVSKLETIAGHECYRIDIACQAAGRQQPKSTVWCDKKTHFLRQFQTQLAVDGQYRTITESYDTAPGQLSPVLPSINALPLAMPAFVPKGSKSLGSFSYKSQPVMSSKDLSVVRFAHSISQEVLPPGAKSLERVPPVLAKELKDKPVTEVRLADHRQKVVQLWQKGAPWPVYTENGRTRAWLVSSKSN